MSIPHVISLGQTFVYCPRFPTAGYLKKLGPCFSSNVIDRSYKPIKDQRLGEPLPNTYYLIFYKRIPQRSVLPLIF